MFGGIKKSVYFCSNRLRRASRRTAYHGGPFFIQSNINYTKSALSLTDQISALQQRGMIISDTIATERFLNDVSYFRFAAYLRVFEQPDRTIRSGTTFEQVSARSFGIAKTDALESWMKAVNALRNLCAHHARVWNRNLPMRTQLPPVMRNAWVLAARTIVEIKNEIVSNKYLQNFQKYTIFAENKLL